MNQGTSSMKGGKILLGVVAGILLLLVIFMGVIYFYQDELQSFVLGEIERQIAVTEPAGYTSEQIGEIFDRYGMIVDTVQVSDSVSLKLGEAFEAAFDDRVIDSSEALVILGLLRELTDPLGPYEYGTPGIVDETSDTDSSSLDAFE